MSTEASTDPQVLYYPIREELLRLEQYLEDQFNREEPFILQLLKYIRRFRGKQIRPALLLMVGKLGGGGLTEDHIKIAGVIELIHTATLVHDDILDDAVLRRNVETLHRRWGERVAVLMGDFIYSRAFAISTEVPGMARVFSQTTNTICEGELLQIRHRFAPGIPEEVYFKIIQKKTAVLYAVACSLGARLCRVNAEDCRRLYRFGMDIGTAFQIVDDCMDYDGEESVVGKSLGTDLHQGKATLPLIYYLKSLTRSRASDVVKLLEEPMAPATEREISWAVRNHGALKAAFETADGYIQSAKSSVEGLPLSVREPLYHVAEYVLRRRK